LNNLKRNKMATIFNHDKNCFRESLGFDAKDIEEMNIKLAKTSQIMLLDQPKQSELCEHIAKEFSYNELLLMSTMYIVDKTAQIIEENPEMVTLLVLQKFMKEQRE